jgi:hypothetical protein
VLLLSALLAAKPLGRRRRAEVGAPVSSSGSGWWTTETRSWTAEPAAPGGTWSAESAATTRAWTAESATAPWPGCEATTTGRPGRTIFTSTCFAHRERTSLKRL